MCVVCVLCVCCISYWRNQGYWRVNIKKLKSSGIHVIANYASNDDSAKKFASESNIDVVKWDVSSFGECEKNVSQIYEKYKNIDILVNNAGITRDAPLHKMSLENWEKSRKCQLKFSF